jgi:hypothetical protein
MIIVVRKDGNQPVFIPSASCLSFFRAFRAELWKAGIKRDPQIGDNILDVEIVSLSI